ncbi:E3 ubiquitin-protein ligase TRIM11-like isoform X2 [Falco biarmicus]|uniref:E3 ubiquitin-protein ligase TRIM11-like n=1 Tax=Falco cherrug TaxID=345164 RepID=UPI0006788219|nr:E3 ubiquitin-protein ligase TRIM11-like isoform X2 [Falco rusticolus]XP_055564914.1 E3 ubiquitin-protein ligase TRIM11-like [Falco cherrug]XP_055661774.1 E3 ubiquitin-protein ligase TRIM11-like [Falco peregrinus]XP_056193424.1 E3 ubiquitin-protein ligase TRIM11-like isoform X2 [Falco biarmicus]
MEREESETLADEVEELNGRADVTLDPATANPFLILAGDQRGVGRGDEWTSLPDSPERFDTEPLSLPYCELSPARALQRSTSESCRDCRGG